MLAVSTTLRHSVAMAWPHTQEEKERKKLRRRGWSKAEVSRGRAGRGALRHRARPRGRPLRPTTAVAAPAGRRSLRAATRRPRARRRRQHGRLLLLLLLLFLLLHPLHGQRRGTSPGLRCRRRRRRRRGGRHRGRRPGCRVGGWGPPRSSRKGRAGGRAAAPPAARPRPPPRGTLVVALSAAAAGAKRQGCKNETRRCGGVCTRRTAAPKGGFVFVCAGVRTPGGRGGAGGGRGGLSSWAHLASWA